MHALHRRLAADSAEWAVALWFAHTLFWLPIIGTPVVFGAQLVRPIVREQIVWLQFLGFALASVVGIGVALRYLERGQVGAALLWGLVAAALCVIAGDQVLWGQRITDLYAMPELRAIHRYQELSQPRSQVTSWMSLAVGLLGVGAPAIVQRRAIAGSNQQMLSLSRPPLFLVPTFLFACATAVFTLLLGQPGVAPASQAATWPQMVLAWALCSGLTLCYRRLTETARDLHMPMSRTI